MSDDTRYTEIEEDVRAIVTEMARNPDWLSDSAADEAFLREHERAAKAIARNWFITGFEAGVLVLGVVLFVTGQLR